MDYFLTQIKTVTEYDDTMQVSLYKHLSVRHNFGVKQHEFVWVARQLARQLRHPLRRDEQLGRRRDCLPSRKNCIVQFVRRRRAILLYLCVHIFTEQNSSISESLEAVYFRFCFASTFPFFLYFFTTHTIAAIQLFRTNSYFYLQN